MVAATAWAIVAATGCGHRTWHYVSVSNANVALPPMAPRTIETRRAGAPPEPLEISSGGSRTVLIAYLAHDNPERDLDQWGRAFVVVFDGPVARGRTEVTPENGRLILHEEFRPARRPYVGLDGYVDVQSVGAGKVTAYCVLRGRLLDAYDDYRIIRGRFEFVPATGGEPFLNDGGIQMR